MITAATLSEKAIRFDGAAMLQPGCGEERKREGPGGNLRMP